MNTLDTCPNSDNGLHRYYFNKMVTEFVPYNGIDKPYDEQVYVKVEYALSACACGRALKERIHYAA